MELKNFTAADLQGNVIPNATVYLFLPNSSTPATGLVDSSGNALTNPFSASDKGRISFAAPDGDYDLQVVGTSLSTTMRIRCADPASLRVDLLSSTPGKGVDLVSGAVKSVDTVSDLRMLPKSAKRVFVGGSASIFDKGAASMRATFRTFQASITACL